MRFFRKSGSIDAVQWTGKGEEFVKIEKVIGVKVQSTGYGIVLSAGDAILTAFPGWWVFRDRATGSVGVCGPNTFKIMHEDVGDE